VTADEHALWDVIGIGENSIDYVYRLPALPSPNAKLPISGHRVAAGGQVATAMCACARLGLRASYIGAFGHDENGRRSRREVERHGVHTGYAVERAVPNRYAVILVDERTSERVVLWERHPSLDLAPAELPAEVIRTARLLHVDGTDETCSIVAARMAREAGVRVTSDIDRVTARTPELIAAVDVVMLAEDVPARLTRDANLESAVRTLRARDTQWVCVTRGAGGATLLADDQVWHSPAFRVTTVDTTAAGDVFRAGFIDAWLRGNAPGEILRYANAAAAVSCTKAGAIDSVPSREEVDALLRAG
jgi:sugar/nucleoside kinase (ribokinase family)